MSYQAVQWALDDAPMLRTKSGKPDTTARAVLVARAERADEFGRDSHAAIEDVIWRTGYDERTIQRAEDRLEAAGLLVRDGTTQFGTTRWNLAMSQKRDPAERAEIETAIEKRKSDNAARERARRAAARAKGPITNPGRMDPASTRVDGDDPRVDADSTRGDLNATRVDATPPEPPTNLPGTPEKPPRNLPLGARCPQAPCAPSRLRLLGTGLKAHSLRTASNHLSLRPQLTTARARSAPRRLSAWSPATLTPADPKTNRAVSSPPPYPPQMPQGPPAGAALASA
ncbi:hypothetical protein GA0074695_4231 [Micromonospora viridifaciens]|uniref:Uncharacterized protein n=1 Tax=Micromonospora viridifaciens TaxID=1881 RepID=A0A1C4YFR2_MICVI|nr:hypothetical protein [Micromonospora viridifaciens]SCF19565.1 hypothetical protein GA0074695_4231 [Micromonospora viridifaciens]